MKVGIVTLNGNTNFGNRLQNYAVSHVLQKKFKCKVETLVAVPEKPFQNGDYRSWLRNQLIMTLCKIPSFAEKRWDATTMRWANFTNWSNRYIPTKFLYEHKTLPQTLDQKYDAFFVGSDQVWNYRFPDVNFNDYLLKFADPKKRVAICASFGIESIPEEIALEYQDALSQFKQISVREKVGAKLVHDLTGREVPVLVDPVMMLDRNEWLSVAKKPRVDISKPYILKYYLGKEAQDSAVDAWAKENGYEIYQLLDENDPGIYAAGPGEFISLIANAALVVTDSFHCVAFSNIFKKPFIVYTRSYMNSRIDTLLETFGLQQRWGHLLTADHYLDCDHSRTDEIIKTEQEKAFQYIKNALG